MRRSARLPILLVLLSGCGRGAGPADEAGTVRVAATIFPVASITRAIGGEAVRVTTLLPPGAHPDTYEATPRVAEALAGSDLLIRIGGAADAWVAAPAGPELVLTEGVRLRGGHDHGRGAGTGNPHVWLDPLFVRDTIVPRITEALAALLPDSAAAFRARAAAYADSLTALDAEIRSMLSGVRAHRFVATHPAWVYFAERYGLEEIGALHPSPGTELRTRDLARLVDEARAERVAAVIAEPQLGQAGADALARELAVRVEVADPVGGAEAEGRSDYLSLMRFNARAFARALGDGS